MGRCAESCCEAVATDTASGCASGVRLRAPGPATTSARSSRHIIRARISPAHLESPALHPECMKPDLRIAVVGTGAIAQIAHLPVLRKIRGVKLVALCDVDRAKARALADRFEIPDVYVDLEDLFGAGDLDAVVVSTPSFLHQPYVL